MLNVDFIFNERWMQIHGMSGLKCRMKSAKNDADQLQGVILVATGQTAELHELEVPMPDLHNCHPNRSARQLIRGLYATHRANSQVTDAFMCAMYYMQLTRPVPLKVTWMETPCCHRLLHPHCFHNKPECTVCHMQVAATHLETFRSRINISNGIHSVRMIIPKPVSLHIGGQFGWCIA